VLFRLTSLLACLLPRGLRSRSRSLGLMARRTLAPRPSASSTAPWTRARAILGTRQPVRGKMGRASSGTALCTRSASTIRENTRKTRSGRNVSLSARYRVWCSGPRPGTRPARPGAADQGRPGRGRRVRAQDGPVADAGPTPTPTWNYLEPSTHTLTTPQTKNRPDVSRYRMVRAVRRWTRSSDEIYVWRH
jgi:hypothetical protein